MQAMFNKFGNSSRSRTGVWVALLTVLTMCLSATVARAGAGPTKPPIITTQVTWLNTLQGGGALSGDNPSGNNFAVDANGNIVISNTYGNDILLINGQTGAVSTLFTSGSGPGSVAMDSQGNLYISEMYAPYILKVPFVDGAYAPVTITGSQGNTNPPTCTGTDTALCTIGQGLQTSANGYWFGISSMAFDPSGNLYISTVYSSSVSNIVECNAKCEFKDGAPTPLYADPNPVGALAFDPWGNLFFTDSVFPAANEVSTSNLNELPFTAGTGFATKPTVLQTLTNVGTALHSYDNELDAVVIDPNGTLYYATQYDGIFAFPDVQGVVDLTGGYGVSTQGSKELALDAKGNLYVATYSTVINSGGTDTVGRVTLNNLTAPASPVGTAAKASATVVDNDGACGTAGAGPTITITADEGGVSTTEFAAAVIPATTSGTPPVTTGGCSTLGPAVVSGNGSSLSTPIAVASYGANLTFTPTNAGERVAALALSDTTNSVTGAATASGVGQGALITIDPGVWNPFTSGFTSPYSISVDIKGDLFVADEGANKVYEIAVGTTAPVAIGTGFSGPEATAFDAAGDLFVADSGNNQIVEFPAGLSGTVDGSSQVTFISDQEKFDGVSLNGPSALAFGPDGVLYIADLENGRVVTYNPSNGVTGVAATGLSHPWGVAVDAANDLYVTNTGDGNVLVYSPSGITTLTPTGVSKPWGVAVDASGSVLVSDKVTGNIVRIPNVAGVLTDSQAMVVETNPKSALGIALDLNGNLYTTDAAGSAVYTVQRTAGAYNFGLVTNGNTASADIWEESAGNSSTALGISAPSLTGAAYSLGLLGTCGTTIFATSIPNGQACSVQVQFAPTTTLTGAQTGTVTLASTALNAPSASVALSGTGTSAIVAEPQTITFPAPPATVVYGVKPITLTATASSGLAVTYTVAGPATVSGSVLTITGKGSVTVTANQAGSANWMPATPVSHTITVDRATLTVTANNASVKYGEPIPALTYKIAGLKNGDHLSVVTGKPDETTKAKEGSKPGPYLISITTGTLEAANYKFTFVDGILIIKVLGTVETPKFTPKGGTFTSVQTVTITDSTTGAVIYYSLGKGNAPDKLYSKPLTVGKTEVINAVAKAPGYDPSAINTQKYTILLQAATPTFTPATEKFTTSVSVTIADATPDATIFYTTNGDTPTITSHVYSHAITLTETKTVKAIAVAPGFTESAVGSATYTLKQ
jgi:sugar lactone lactonase YvrE